MVLSDLKETGNFDNDLKYTVGWDTVLSKARNDVAADVVIKLIAVPKPEEQTICGIAHKFSPQAYAYGLVSARFLKERGDCFSHEWGHLVGADHDMATDKPPEPYFYDHGLYYVPADASAPSRFKTIMAYDLEKCKNVEYLRAFSNPLLLYV